MFFFTRLKKFYIYLAIFVLFLVILNFNVVSAASDVENIMTVHKGAVYPGQVIYFSNYIFKSDVLFFLKKEDFISALNLMLPPFDHFYCKVILPNNEMRWCLVTFTELGCNITEFSLNSSIAFDALFPYAIEPYIKGSNLDWTLAFSNNVQITFITTIDGALRIYAETSSVCKV